MKEFLSRWKPLDILIAIVAFSNILYLLLNVAGLSTIGISLTVAGIVFGWMIGTKHRG